MTSKRALIQQLNHRPDVGAMEPGAPRFSTKFLTDVDGVLARVNDDQVLGAALRIAAERMVRSTPLLGSRATREYLMLRFARLEYEVFACLYLDNRSRVIDCEELFRGTINGSSVHPREVVKRALRYNAAAIILAHNHPSGVAEPSQDDEHVTQRLKQALALVDIRLLDHFIIGDAVAESMAERGLL